MKKFQILIQSLVILVVIITINACGPTNPELVYIDPGFNEYISGYTSGMVERKDAIRIELVEESKSLVDYSQEELNELFEIEPAVEGKAIAISDRLIEFVPAEPLPVSQFYTVHFNLQSITNVESGFEEFVFQFATFDQKIDVDVDGLSSYNRYQIEYQKLTGTISTSDYEDTTELKKTLNVSIDGKNLPVKFKARNYGNRLNFTVDSIKRLDREQKLLVSWDGVNIHSFSKGQKEITVTSLGDFTVSQAKVIDEEDQRVELRFSEPLKARQNLKGIVTIDGIEDLTYKIDFNVLQIYLPNRYLGYKELKVRTGVKNIAGYRMNETYTRQLRFREPNPHVRLLGEGSILPNSQGLIFPFEAIALKSVDVRVIRIHENNVHHFLQVNDLDDNSELTRFGTIVAEEKIDLQKGKKKNLKQWNTHIIDLGKLIKAEPGAIYEVAIKYDKEDAVCDCAFEDEEQGETDHSSDVADWNERFWHRYGFNGYSTWNYGYDDNDPCEDSYYYGRAVKRNILASNIGIVFKLDENKKSHIILSDMVSTQPIQGASISFYDYTKQLIAKVSTDERGMASVRLKKKPFLMIAKKGQQRGYLKLTDGKVNSMSKFDVDGTVVQKGVKGFIYADRGVWRPGDSLFVNFMLQDKNKTLPLGHPVSFKFIDPNGNVLQEESKTKHVNGVYDFRCATSADARTGTYRAHIKVGNKTYTKSLRVETIKPNRLKIYLDVKHASHSDSCYLESKWLHGASAKDLKAEVQVRLSPMRTQFKEFKDFIFDSPVRNGRADNRVVFNGLLDEEGKAKFKTQLTGMKEASGMLQAFYTTKVFEKGGEFSIDRTISSYSPFSTYVGIASPKGSIYDRTLETNKQHRFEIVTVNQKGKLVKGKKVKVSVYKLSWNWWYDGDEDFTSFTARNAAVLYKDTLVNTVNGKASFYLKTTDNEYGKYLIIATDQHGRHQTGKVVHFDWPYWSRVNRSENEHAAMLTFSTDKKSYTRGEKVKLSFPSPSKGRALVSIETSEKVLDKFWIETVKGETTHEFTTTAAMAPNAFIHVTLIQPHHATKNDLPIRMYGVMPIMVDDPATHLSPIITMKDKIRPESKAAITIKEKEGKKMTYTLAIVDEGLLDLTHFRTPNPWNTFYAKEALGVKTWDMYEDVIGAYAGKLEHLLSIGGDGSAVVGDGPKANRFKPMVRFIGPFELPAGASKKHWIDIPNYVGSVRVMVVARDREAYGNAEKTVTVKKPLMLLATVPRVLGPGEEFSLPVDVFAMEKHVKNVNIQIETNGMLELVDSRQKAIQFSKEGDEVVNFKVKTKEALGVAKIKIIARSGTEEAIQEIEVDVRPSNPEVYEVQEFELAAGSTISAKLIMDGLRGTNSGTIEFSTLPAINLEKRLNYLVHYPHGCVEQTTSAVFPQLYLSSMLILTDKEKKQIDHNIRAGIDRLQLFQTSDGGFAYWPGENYTTDWGTNYAGHFLLEAELRGYRLPSGMKNKWIAHQREKARNWTLSTSVRGRESSSDQLTQAYRLYLLALCNNQEIGAMNRLREQRNLSNVAKWRLASAYAIIGQAEAAEKLMKSATTDVSYYKELSRSFGSGLRDKAIILEVQGILNQKNDGLQTMKYIAQQMRSKRWMSTQETSYCLLAIAKYCQLGDESKSVSYQYSIDGGSHKSGTIGSKMRTVRISEKGGVKNRSVSITNKGISPLFITVTTEKVPFKQKEKKEFSKLNMSLNYTDLEGNRIDITTIEQGTEFIAEVQLTNTSKDEYYEQMALNQIFPSGWEIHNTRLFGNKGVVNDARYQDIRDDRVLSYYNLRPGQSKTIRVILSATYKGHYYHPTLYSEAMYDHAIHARIPGKWITVK